MMIVAFKSDLIYCLLGSLMNISQRHGSKVIILLLRILKSCFLLKFIQKLCASFACRLTQLISRMLVSVMLLHWLWSLVHKLGA